LLQRLDKFLPNLILFVVDFKGISFLLGAISPNWRYIDQSCPVLDEGSSLDWNFYICDVVQAKPNEFF